MSADVLPRTHHGAAHIGRSAHGLAQREMCSATATVTTAIELERIMAQSRVDATADASQSPTAGTMAKAELAVETLQGCANVTILTSDKGYLTKSFTDVNGQIRKESHAFLVRGTAETREVRNLAELDDLLNILGPNQAVTYGRTAGQNGIVVSQSTKDAPVGAITRTREYFQFPEAPGYMMLDYDPPNDGVAPQPDDLINMLYEAWPALKGIGLLWRPSSSSGVAGAGIRGQRIYIKVSNASHIPRIGALLFQRLWLAGYGYYAISKSGQLLERGPIDASVWQPERMDFAAQPVLGPGVSRTSYGSKFIDGSVLDVTELDELSVAEMETLKVMKANARHVLEPRVAAVQDEYTEAKSKELPVILAKRGVQTVEHAVVAMVTCAIKHNKLARNWPLTTRDGSVVTVGEIMDAPEKWHGARFADPLEPSHDMRVAYANLLDTDRPNIFSHAHHGTRYWLDEGIDGVDISMLLENAKRIPHTAETNDSVGDEPAGPDSLQAPVPVIQRYKLWTAHDLANAPPLQWMIRGLFPQTGLAALYGASGAGKSFLALDLAATVAGGATEWYGKRVKNCPVTYCALEGEGGMGKRAKAWAQHHGKLLPDMLRFVTQPINLQQPQDVKDLADAIINAGGAGGLVILDTLNRAAPEADENSSKDMGAIIAAAKALQGLTGGLVMLVHHTGKNSELGMRGHSSLFAAMDSVISVTKIQWEVKKSKDDATGAQHQFKLEKLVLGVDDEGEEISSCVAVPSAAAFAQRQSKKLGPHQVIALETIKGMGSDFISSVQYDKALAAVAEKLVEVDSKHKRQRAKEAIGALIDMGKLSLSNNYLRPVEPA